MSAPAISSVPREINDLKTALEKFVFSDKPYPIQTINQCHHAFSACFDDFSCPPQTANELDCIASIARADIKNFPQAQFAKDLEELQRNLATVQESLAKSKTGADSVGTK